MFNERNPRHPDVRRESRTNPIPQGTPSTIVTARSVHGLFWSVAMVARFTRTNPRGRRVLDRRNEPTTPALRSSIARTNPIPRGRSATIVAARLVRGLVGQWLGSLDLRERTHESGQRRTGETNPRHGTLIKNRANEPNSAPNARHNHHDGIDAWPRSAIVRVTRSTRTNPREWPASPTKRSHDTGSWSRIAQTNPILPRRSAQSTPPEGPVGQCVPAQSLETNPREWTPTVRRNEADTVDPMVTNCANEPNFTVDNRYNCQNAMGLSSMRPVTRSTKRTHENSQRQFDETNPRRPGPCRECANEPTGKDGGMRTENARTHKSEQRQFDETKPPQGDSPQELRERTQFHRGQSV